MSRRALQLAWSIFGVVAVAFGALAVLTGGALILDNGDVSASVDSELRFYGAWYLGAGVLVLRTAPRVDSDTATVRAICAVLFLAACGRILSIVVVGRPHASFLALMVVEFVFSVVMVPWQAAVARRGGRRAGPRRARE